MREKERKKQRKRERKKERKKEGRRKEGRKEGRMEGRKEGRKERKKNAPTETGPLPQSHAQDLFVNRVRGNPLIKIDPVACRGNFRALESQLPTSHTWATMDLCEPIL